VAPVKAPMQLFGYLRSQWSGDYDLVVILPSAGPLAFQYSGLR